MTEEQAMQANDLLAAIQRQRDSAINTVVQLEVKLLAANREIERLKKLIPPSEEAPA